MLRDGLMSILGAVHAARGISAEGIVRVETTYEHSADGNRSACHCEEPQHYRCYKLARV